MVKIAFAKNWVRKTLFVLLCIMMTGVLCAGTVYSEKQTNKDKDDVEVLYYDKTSGIKIVNKNNFLLKVEKNEEGLEIVQELGPYPHAYPDDLPSPKTHIDKESD